MSDNFERAVRDVMVTYFDCGYRDAIRNRNDVTTPVSKAETERVTAKLRTALLADMGSDEQTVLVTGRIVSPGDFSVVQFWTGTHLASLTIPRESMIINEPATAKKPTK